MILLAGAAISLIYFINTRKGIRIFAGFAVVFALALGARYSDYLLQTVEKYIVKPNESSKERPYIQNNIKSTLSAYRLDDVEVRDFNPERIPTDISIPEIQSILRNTPVWDGELLDDVYKQLQNLRTYYDFPGVDVDRYTVNGLYQQVFLSARELNQASNSGRRPELDKRTPFLYSWIWSRDDPGGPGRRRTDGLVPAGNSAGVGVRVQNRAAGYLFWADCQ